MEKLRTSWMIFRHSLDVMRRNPRLLLFVLVGIFASLPVYLFILEPLVTHMTLTQIWFALWNPDEGWQELSPFEIGTKGNLSLRGPLLAYAVCYLLSMFMMTFLNVALYSQILEAMNGGRVSLSRALRWPAGNCPR